MKVARFLARHPAVEKVHYPGLPDHPGHKIAARQMSAFGGMLSFQVRGARETAHRRWRRSASCSSAPPAWAARTA